MAQRGRPGLSLVDKRELWRRWKDGQTLTEIGIALGKHAASIHGVLAIRGGICPPAKSRAERVLSSTDREEISRSLAAGMSVRNIARTLQRAPSTISREISRNGGPSHYRATSADERAWAQAQRPKRCHLAVHAVLRQLVAAKLQDNWSPQQIAGWLALEHGEDPTMRVLHETIYRSLFIQARGVLKRELIAHLRSRRMMRRGKTATTAGQPRGQIVDAISISERPAEVEDRAVPGDTLGRAVNEKCVGRLVSEHDFQSRKRRQFRVVTTDSKHQRSIAPNVLERDFTASAPNQKWLADMTYVWTLEGCLYLALVLDLYACKLVGWAMSETMPQALTLEALRVALDLRNPDAGLTHHSDRDSQYAAKDYRDVLKARGITVSMSGNGDCWDNAPMESVNGTLKVECVHGETFATREQARQAIVQYIGYYNTERRHSALGNVAPAWFEQQWMKTTQIAAQGNR